MTSDLGTPPDADAIRAAAEADAREAEEELEGVDDDEIEPEEEPDPAERLAEVDGQTARVLFDGRTGQPAGELIQETDSDVLGNLTRAMELEAAARTAKNKAANAWAKTEKDLKAAAAHAAAHYVASRQLTMDLNVGGTQPDDTDEGE